MISIIRATPGDAALLTDIGKKTFIESHGHSASAVDIDSYVSRKFTLETLQEELTAPGNIFHIIYYNNEPAGYSKIIFDSPYPSIKVEHITKLERIYLLQKFYDLKLGAKLLTFNTELSKASGQRGMWLYTWTENKRAVSFYKKAGFQIVGYADFKISENHSNPNHIMYLEY
jgi:ribosomal protein S18 acetylase RimI-like enzyme